MRRRHTQEGRRTLIQRTSVGDLIMPRVRARSRVSADMYATSVTRAAECVN